MKIFLLVAITALTISKGYAVELVEPYSQALASAGRYVSVSGDYAITPGYIYEKNTSGVWVEKGTTIGGNLVAIDGNTAINGNRVYERNLDGTWSASQTLSLGTSRKLGVAISGNYIAVLLTHGTEVFRKNGSVWQPMQTLNTPADTNDFLSYLTLIWTETISSLAAEALPTYTNLMVVLGI